ncbi:PEP-CTERM sorting domain-containing protein [methane-oxidizing endosymbiont of Gigantopelta aegis]|uniref:PEP-CTERM sorting domain-containing protein n=1 Tax=methane-oxidizing endosymbiont of Gigantopelta aegis TaxID=2794938 RepID=UPI0018DB9E5E|nr:PEP-CTERM sorting domain-containing protein [methane-oxidizing endosymbiont of Gigantopelta aegis]
MNFFKQTILVSTLSAAAMSVQATPFYIDLNGTGVGNGFSDATNCPTCTSDANELTVKYQSHTAIDLASAGGAGLDVGDTLVTTGGYSTDGFSVNAVTGLNPSGADYGFSNTSFAAANDWGLTFEFNLIGQVASVINGTDVGDVIYNGGYIDMLFVKFDGLGGIASTEQAMRLNVTGSDLDNNSNLLIFGTLDFSLNTGNTYDSLFNIQGGASCAGDISFRGLAECVPALDFTFVIDQNLNQPSVESLVGNILTVGGTHDGSLAFNVPEPSTLALLSSVLFGLGGALRRKA